MRYHLQLLAVGLHFIGASSQDNYPEIPSTFTPLPCNELNVSGGHFRDPAADELMNFFLPQIPPPKQAASTIERINNTTEAAVNLLKNKNIANSASTNKPDVIN